MRNIILSAIVVLGLAACEGTGDRTYNAPDLDTATGPITGGEGSDNNQSVDDTTPTTNNNLYHTDSATGQGSAYDTSSLNNQKNANNPGRADTQNKNNTNL
jgi:hypothetical protein